MPNYDKLRLHRAIVFAAKAHQGQNRKGTDVPYIIHPFETAQILVEAGCSEDIVIAGLLHDTLEDTETTTNEISQFFGLKVLGLVLSVSEDKRKTWEQRKQHTIDYLRASADYDEMLLTCADKLSNLRSLRLEEEKSGDEVWLRFKRGRDLQSWYYSEIINALEPISDYVMYGELVQLYNEIFK